MKLNVIGLGYIGLPTAAIFADNNTDVVGVDINHNIVRSINQGKIHIEEPGLSEMVRRAVVSGKLVARTEPCEADVYIIAVPTPNANDGYMGCDLTYVLSAAHSIMPYVSKGNTIIIESTIAPRTTEDYIKPILEEAGFTVGVDIFLAHCPERVLPGKIINELVSNSRIIGGITQACTKKAADIYRLFVKGEIIETCAKTAEMSKLVENTFRDVNIALANELTKVCNVLDINVLDVIKMANKHPRVNVHMPGPGVGGHCLAVDPYFIYAKAPRQAQLIKMARDINKSMPDFVVEHVEKLHSSFKSLPIAVFGVTYKPDVDDIRESPALKIIDQLKSRGYLVRIHDPHVENLDYMDANEALRGAGMLLCLTGHSIFAQIDGKLIKRLMARPLIFDITDTLQYKEAEIINYGNLYQYL